MEKPLIERVFEEAGGRDVLRKSLGLSKQSMSDWLRTGVVPVKHCARVAFLTGIPLAELNPVFDMPKKPAKRAKAAVAEAGG